MQSKIIFRLYNVKILKIMS